MNSSKIKTVLENVKAKKKQISAHQFKEIYKELGIDLDDLGCIMLDTEPLICQELIDNKDWLYKTENKKRFWIGGYVADKTAHITLKYGLLEGGNKWKKYVDKVLDGWKLSEIVIDSIGVFDSPHEDDPYFCVVGKVEVTDKLLEGHNRLNMLPNVSTFDSYIPHLTIAYIKKDQEIKNKALNILNKTVKGKKLKVKNINYGTKK
jgi:2'-5' RNA ligase